MGRYDDITPEQLRTELTRFARLILRMADDESLLERAPRILKMMGELRQMLFAWEVRGTKRLAPEKEGGDPATAANPEAPELRESLRIVREAVERERRLLEDLEDGFPGDDEAGGRG